jgi:hypothetical protein
MRAEKFGLKSTRVQTNEVAGLIYEELNTPVSLSCWMMLHSGFLIPGQTEIQQLVGKKADPAQYLDNLNGAERFRKDYLAVSLLSKIDRDIGLKPDEVARTKWYQAEELNRQTNWRFRHSLDSTYGSRWSEHLKLAKRKISDLLGPFSWGEASKGFNFGPGVTQEAGGEVSLPKKFAASAVVSPHGFLPASHIIGLTPRWYEELTGTLPDGPCCYLDLATDDEARVTMVPKSAKTLRAIAIEHGINIYLQKGIGAVLRSRLRKAGIDLDDQLPNQVGAYLGSLLGLLATIDLSMASDTVCTGLVRELLPDDWFIALNSVRSRRALMEGDSIITQKFSSMGNGFTFELESLIFWALASAVSSLSHLPFARRKVLVYGDDLIVDTEIAHDLLSLLSWCGFCANADKTFLQGPFRESCGRDFFLGYDVRPFFIKKDLENLEDYFKVYNQVLKWSSGSNTRLSKTLGALFRSVKASNRYRVPHFWGPDTGFFSTFDQAHPILSEGPLLRIHRLNNDGPDFEDVSRGWAVFRFEYYGVKPVSQQALGPACMAARLNPHRLQSPWVQLLSAEGWQPPLDDLLHWMDPSEDPDSSGNEFTVRSRKLKRRPAVGYSHIWP